MTRRTLPIFIAAALAASAETPRWNEAKANQWYGQHAWLVGANYTPATAINQLEMWQVDTFDPKRIDLELGWAESIGMNTMRVFLHDLLWQRDAAGFKSRLDTFLKICEKHGIKPILVLFDSVWDPNPQLGKQRAPKPGVHNSGWVQSPGAKALQDATQQQRLQAYVKGVIGAFANDQRVLAWDIWNEPENPNKSAYGNVELKNKSDLVLGLLPKTFAWARAVKPSQPLTVGVWEGDWSSHEKMTVANKMYVELSDVISFHNYGAAGDLEKRIQYLQRYKRPILCTEYMARGNKSTFEGSLPVLKKYNVAAINWGLVAGKTQTHLPWDSWQKAYVGREPAVWFHEVFKNDGTPYKPEEVTLIRQLTGRGAKAKGATAR